MGIYISFDVTNGISHMYHGKNNTNKRKTPSNNNVKREGGGHRVTISAY